MKFQVPAMLRWCWKGVTWRENKKEKCIYLTFDDGPIPEVTPKVLDILDEFDVKATFLCVGDNVKKHPETYREVLRRGHRVGNHTFNHIKGFGFSADEYVGNVKKASEYVESKLFRPPHGQITHKQIKRLSSDYRIIMWDFITFDYDKAFSVEKIMKIVRNKTRNGSIVIFHDSLKAEKNVLEALPQALKFWKEEGYELKVIG
ncbi:Polysaccharide deacetylase [uncultured Paludibacter sp.]|uniref:Polysaccharide deacetylase n=1 Tax=uncultured Paludibacter sp. TaxID=497635 RepID=A0A653AIV0_9BACT|nr:Polysaccharide deacetylase [uncultured Paludibacter sp.]